MQNKNTQKPRRKYDVSFKQEVVSMIAAGRPVIQQSMSRADDPYDNASMESFFSRLKAELLENGMFENLEDAQTELFEFTEMYYNTERKHSSLNYQSPMDYENHYFYSLT